MEQRSLSTNWNSKIIIGMILLILLFWACSQNEQTNKSVEGNPIKIQNEILRKNILDFSQQVKKPNEKDKDLLFLNIRINQDTVKYTIWRIPDLSFLLDANIMAVTKVDDVYACIEIISLPKIGLQENALMQQLKDDFPDMHRQYRKLKATTQGNVKDLVPLRMFVDEEEWHLTFVKDSLISKTILNHYSVK